MGFRLLLAGKPKAAKTGALCALANAGYRIRYWNFDNNTDPLFAYTKKENRKNIQILDCLDDLSISEAGYARAGGSQNLKAWTTMVRSMNEWPIDKSKPKLWTDRDILVLDSLTFCAQGLARRIQVLSNSEGKKFSWNDYAQTQKELDNLLACLKQWLPKAHFIACAHTKLHGPDLNVTDIEDDELKEKMLREKLNAAEVVPWGLGPRTFGNAQTDFFDAHFSGSALVKHVDGRGRMIYTVPTDGFNAGIPVEGIGKELPIETGLATIFDKINKQRA